MYLTRAPNPNLEPFSVQGKDLADPTAFASPDLTRQKMLARLLSASGNKSQQGTQYVNGWAVPQSGAEGLGGLANGLVSAYLMGNK